MSNYNVLLREYRDAKARLQENREYKKTKTIRIYPSIQKKLVEVANKQGKTQQELIEQGIEIVLKAYE